MAADPTETSLGVVPSILRPGPDSVRGPAGPLRRPAARRRGARAIATSSAGRPRALAAGEPSESGAHVDLVTGRLTLTGRLDVRTTHLLYDAVSALLRADHPGWTLDVGGLTDVDDAGLRALLVAYRRALRHGRRITVVGASPSLQYALTLLRLDRHVLPAEGAPVPADPGPG
ncbi:STAS domain-containing protein [Geodermatophilus sp. CPCC 205506]|uniref:STAS domain-containing protein n=1 Tax=Geodermatophilus sp. CPCC 205506 TaxID=2936596 RepID=UPI003EEAA3BF